MNLRLIVKPTYRSTSHGTFSMSTLPWTHFQARCTGDGARFGTLVVNAALAAGLLALAVASFVLGVTWSSAKMLTIQRTLARVFGVVYACDRSRSNLLDVQVQFLTLPASSLTFPGTATHRFVTEFGASCRGWVLVTSNLFRVFAVWELLLNHLLTLDGLQLLEQAAGRNENSHLYHSRRITPRLTKGLASLRDHRAESH